MALLEGRIIGRIVKEHLGHYHTVLGPSPVVTVYRQGFSYTDLSDFTHWDDRLTDDEISCICGLYCCYTGRKNLSYFYLSFIDTVTRQWLSDVGSFMVADFHALE